MTLHTALHTASLPVGVTRLLAIAAMDQGLSLDDYITALLTDHARQIMAREYRLELADIRLEHESANFTLLEVPA